MPHSAFKVAVSSGIWSFPIQLHLWLPKREILILRFWMLFYVQIWMPAILLLHHRQWSGWWCLICSWLKWGRNLKSKKALPIIRNCLNITLKSTSENGSSFLEQHDATIESLAFGGKPHSSDEIKDTPSSTSHREPSSDVVDDSVGARLLSHRHGC